MGFPLPESDRSNPCLIRNSSRKRSLTTLSQRRNFSRNAQPLLKRWAKSAWKRFAKETKSAFSATVAVPLTPSISRRRSWFATHEIAKVCLLSHLPSTLTACANDFGYDSVFARQVEALCVPGDIVVGISTSGTSGNVVEGLRFAKENNITTFAFTGEKGATCGEIADQLLAVPSTVTARVQECHLIAGHLICDIIEIAFADQESTISAC